MKNIFRRCSASLLVSHGLQQVKIHSSYKSIRIRGAELSTWEHLLSWAGREPDQVRCLGTVSQVHPQQHSWVATRTSPTPTPPRLPAQPQLCHHQFLHKHTQPGSTASVSEPRQQNGIFQPGHLPDLTPCTDTEFYPGRSSSLRCLKHNSIKHLPQMPNTAATSPLSYPHLLQSTGQFPAIPLDEDQDNYADTKIYDLHRDGIVDSVAK